MKPSKRTARAEAAMTHRARKPDMTRPDKAELVRRLKEAARRAAD